MRALKAQNGLLTCDFFVGQRVRRLQRTHNNACTLRATQTSPMRSVQTTGEGTALSGSMNTALCDLILVPVRGALEKHLLTYLLPTYMYMYVSSCDLTTV